MKKITSKNWIDPDDFASLVASNYTGNTWSYLKSGQFNEVKSSKSIILLFEKEEIIGKDLDFLVKNKLKSSHNKNYQDGYLTLLSYEYNQKIEAKYLQSKESFIELPVSLFIKFSVIYEFDHDKKKLAIYYDDKKYLDEISRFSKAPKNAKFKNPTLKDINSNFSYDEYYQAIENIQDKIRDGVCYQSNLTRKFFGHFVQKPNQQESLGAFLELSKENPANYSCFVKYHNKYILSNSPELFIKSRANTVTSQPIKGTSSRSKNFIIDFFNKKYLTFSKKERAENLMITDLVRNDLSLFSDPGSVFVDNLFKVDSHNSYHHLSTIVKSKLSKNKDIAAIIKGAFPPASMTGTPKISAANVACSLENMKRGIYSGTIGLINGKKEANLSVVIRTIIIENDKFEFQVGGAITIDSKPHKEIQETFTKAKKICKILSIKSLKNIDKKV